MAAGDVDVDIRSMNAKKCAMFDGTDDKITLPINYPTSWSEQFSISIWIYVPSGAIWSNGYYSNIIGKGNFDGIIGITRDEDTDNNVRFFIRHGSGTNIRGTYIERDTWHHIVAVYNGSAMRIYNNGVAGDYLGVAFTGSPDNTNWSIGEDIGFTGGLGSWYKGAIGEVRIYKKALTEAEVMSIYNGGNVPGYMARYKFDDYTDETGNFNATNDGTRLMLLDSGISSYLMASGPITKISGAEVFAAWDAGIGNVETVVIRGA